ncbi:MAG: transglutaminase domain-containing protein [Clostridia bacterium]|nr:transglutaminase domain-containing protein [Clostridia bacterium]
MSGQAPAVPTKGGKKPAPAILLLTFTAVFCAAFTAVLLPALNITAGFSLLLPAALFFSAAFGLLSRSRRAALIACAAVVAVAAAMAVTPLRGALWGFCVWAVQYAAGSAATDAGYASAAALLICFAVTLVFFFVSFRLQAGRATAALAAAALVFSAVSADNASSASLYLLAAFMLAFYPLGVYRAGQRKARRRGEAHAGETASTPHFVLYALPALIVTMLLMVGLPKSGYPIQWAWLDNIYNNFYQETVVFSADSARIFSAGYQVQGGSLDGSCFPNNIHVLDVSATRQAYLKCSVKNVYTGFSWSDTLRSSLPYTAQGNESAAALYELEHGITYLSSDGIGALKGISGSDPVTVTFAKIRADYLFVPPLLSALVTSPAAASVRSGGQITLDRKMSQGYSYSFSNIWLDYGSEKFQKLLRASKTDLYASAVPKGADASAQKRLISLAHDAYADYTQLPASLPARVRSLAVKITTSSKNNYDRVKAIEQYLADNEDYTLTPPKRPTGRDFTDYFLFDSRQGYCTSYATAMAVLVRCLGLPARYCEGYCMPSQKSDDGVYEITNLSAHAWVEVYFEGFGWVPFEPTETYNQDFYSGADRPSQEGNSPLKIPPQTQQQETDSHQQSQPPTQSSQPQAVKPTGNHAPRIASWLLDIAIPVVLAALLLLLAAAFNASRRRVLLARARRMPAREGIVLLYSLFLKALKPCGLEPAADETVFELRQRLSQCDRFFASQQFGEVTAVFAAARYGCREPQARELDLMLAFGQPLRGWLVSRLGKPKYLIFRHLLGVL